MVFPKPPVWKFTDLFIKHAASCVHLRSVKSECWTGSRKSAHSESTRGSTGRSFGSGPHGNEEKQPVQERSCRSQVERFKVRTCHSIIWKDKHRNKWLLKGKWEKVGWFCTLLDCEAILGHRSSSSVSTSVRILPVGFSVGLSSVKIVHRIFPFLNGHFL